MNKYILDKWMVKVSEGDNEAFCRLYEGMKRGVYAFAYSYLNNSADAEDMVEETFFQIKKKAYLYNKGTDARAWVFQIVKNLCLDHLRKRKRERENTGELTGNESTVQRMPMLDDMVACLSEDEKEIVILHVVWEYKHKEISEMLNIPLGTVTWKYKQAIEKLRNKQEEEL